VPTIPIPLRTDPLSEREPGSDRDLGCAPVLGAQVLEWDCCSRETWVVVGPSLGDGEPMLLVESIQAQQHYYDGPIHWEVVDSLEAPSLADAVAAFVELVEHVQSYGRCSCP
jgi:hypothetical protein